MKRLSLLYLFIFIIPITINIYSQESLFLTTIDVEDGEIKKNLILQQQESFTGIDLIALDLSKIFNDEDSLRLRIGPEYHIVKKEYVNIRGSNSYVIVAKNSDGCYILLSVLDDDVQGLLKTSDNVYTIITLGLKEYALVQVDYSYLNEACEFLGLGSDAFAKDLEGSFSPTGKIDNDSANTLPERSSNRICNIRVLVLYTAAAKNSVSNINNTILTAVEFTNQSFVNSNINYKIELVYSGLTTYSESLCTQDLYRFAGENEGYMDEVHTLRDKYNADVCVLMEYTTDFCGLASVIGATQANAFCLVSTYSTCATTNYSFGHEIGHLLGCRHDTYVDNNSIPYAYGHGYINSSQDWRTIMAYPDQCNYCERLLYWSNPDVLYYGENMGTAILNNNARVWNERANTVMSFRQPDYNVTVTNSDVINADFGNIIAKNNIVTNGTAIINAGTVMRLIAGTDVELKDGFHATNGSDFVARIEEVDDCGILSKNSEKVKMQKNNSIVPDEISDFSFEIYPNPSRSVINITCVLSRESVVEMEIVNMFGEKVKMIKPTIKSEGVHRFNISIAELSKGVYYLNISFDGQKRTKKLVVS